MEKIINILNKQKQYKKLNQIAKTKLIKQQLNKLLTTVIDHEHEIYMALNKDMNKNEAEVYLSEFLPVIHEIKWFIKHLDNIHKTKNKTKLNSVFLYRNYETRKAYGNTIIYSSYNYPFQLSMVPLIGAIACNNTVILKPAESNKNINNVIEKIINKMFMDEQCYVIPEALNNHEIYSTLYVLDVDLVFFTGSYENGRKIYENYAKQMIPVILELGGKSPVIIEQSANLEQAAKRLVWAKMLNCGQTCVAPDYIIIHSSLIEKFIKLFIQEFNLQYPEKSIKHDLSKCPENQIKRINELSANLDTYWSTNNHNGNKFKLIKDHNFENKIWKEEIFGPLLPIITFENKQEIYDIVDRNKNPLTMYIFSKNKKFIHELHHNIASGSTAINDCIVHLNSPMPFGGIKQSGIGQYHGIASVNCFMRIQPLVKCTNIELDARYSPTSDKKLKKLKSFVK